MRLLRWPRRRTEPVGRHSRVLTGVSMPGAAASLVSSTVTAESVVAEAEEVAASSRSVTGWDRGRVRSRPARDAGAVRRRRQRRCLEADDPRVRTFRAAAAALLDAPRA